MELDFLQKSTKGRNVPYAYNVDEFNTIKNQLMCQQLPTVGKKLDCCCATYQYFFYASSQVVDHISYSILYGNTYIPPSPILLVSVAIKALKKF